MMVVFNDSVPVENPALQAVLMALELRDALGALTQTWSRLGHEIGFGIGIAHGFATLGTIGYEGRFDYAAIGTVSNVASRLCDEAKPGQILISPRVLTKVESAVKVEPVGEFELKGIRRPLAAYIALALIFAPPASMVHAVGDAHKVSVVSFGLFGDQGVFRSEATGAAQVAAGSFGRGSINVQYHSKKGGGATIQGLAMALQAAANGMDAENDVLFVILTSHGSRAGLAVKAGRLTQLLTPVNLADMLALTGVRHNVVVISACYSGVFIPVSRTPMC